VTCRDLTDFLASYLGDDLAPDIRSTFDRHLAACANCQRFLKQYEQTLTAGQRAFVLDDETPIPDDLVRAILNSLRQDS
jgi:hypothetical protein